MTPDDIFKANADRISEILRSEPYTEESLLEAAGLASQMLDMDVRNPHSLFLLGTVYMKAGKIGIADALLGFADHLKPLPEIKNNLGWLYQHRGLFDKATECFEQSLAILPEGHAGRTEVLSNLASGFVNNGTPDKAIEMTNEVLAIEPDNTDAIWNQALAYLEKGEWAKGWAGYRKGLDLGPASSVSRKARHYKDDLPYWEGDTSQRVVIYGEQGVGDELLGYSMLPDLAESVPEVILETHPRLVNIARHAFADRMTVYGTRKADPQRLPWRNWQEVDAKLPLLQLGEYYRQKDEDFPRKPYLKSFDHLVEAYRAKFKEKAGNRPVIGISWAGGTTVTRQDLRSIDLAMWAGLMQGFDAHWVSLQYDIASNIGAYEHLVRHFNDHFRAELHHDTDMVNDLDLCYGGAIHACDLVISVCNSLIHACGAFGGPEVWCLVPSRPAWRFGLERDHMLWYGDNVKLLRQEGEDWRPMMRLVLQKLYEKF